MSLYELSQYNYDITTLAFYSVKPLSQHVDYQCTVLPLHCHGPIPENIAIILSANGMSCTFKFNFD